MKLMYMKKSNSEKLFNNFLDNYDEDTYYNDLSDDYNKLRFDILNMYYGVDHQNDYLGDLEFGLELYKYFNDQDYFNETLASNYEFWIYLSIMVVPDIIKERYGVNPERYYSKKVRIYLSSLWWYIHLCWQGSIDKTRECLNDFSTDYIMQLTERPGKNGVYLEVTRNIIKKIASIPTEVRNKKVGSNNLFRRVMILNHAKIDNFNLLFEDECDEYVDEIIKECIV